MKEFNRTDRVSEQLQKELAILLQKEIKDPRLRFTTVAAVDLSKDLKVAKVYVTFMDEGLKKDIQQRLELLSKAAGFLRSALGKQMRMRAIPELHFNYDDSLTRGRELSSLIDKAIAADDEKKQHDQSSDEE